MVMAVFGKFTNGEHFNRKSYVLSGCLYQFSTYLSRNRSEASQILEILNHEEIDSISMLI